MFHDWRLTVSMPPLPDQDSPFGPPCLPTVPVLAHVTLIRSLWGLPFLHACKRGCLTQREAPPPATDADGRDVGAGASSSERTARRWRKSSGTSEPSFASLLAKTLSKVRIPAGTVLHQDELV